MTSNFKHIEASEQIQDGTVTASLLSPTAAVLTLHSDSNSNLTGNIQLVSGSHVTLSQTGQAITVNATGELSQTLTTNHIFVGNISNIATDVPMSGDATIVASGALTLSTVNSNVGSFTNANITVNAKGLITAASNGSSGANTSLSNLTSPTALNQDILPASDGSRSLGSSSLQLSQVFTYNVNSNNDDLDLTSTFNVYLASGPSSDIVLNAGSGHINADTHNITNMADPVNPQDAATKNYVDSHFLMLSGGTLTGSLGIGESPLASAVLDVASTTQGFLPPRMTTTQRTAISSPAEGLQVYDLTVHQLYQWNGSSWVILG